MKKYKVRDHIYFDQAYVGVTRGTIVKELREKE